MNAIKYIILTVLFMLSGRSSGQELTVISTSATGRFLTCDNGVPEIMVNFVSSDGGTSVQNGSLTVNDPCGFTTLNIKINGIKWNTIPNSNWIHGLFFLPGISVTISGASLPDGWILSDSLTGAVCSEQETGGVGFYFDGSPEGQCCSPLSANDGDPSNNYGDLSINCNNAFDISFNVTFCNSSVLENHLDFELKGTADGNTGCFTSPDSIENFIRFSVLSHPETPLYAPFPVNSQILVSCVDDEVEYAAVLTGGCGNNNTITWWSDPVAGVQLGSGSGFVYAKPDGSCPAGEIIYAQCCPAGLTCSRYPVQIGDCPPIDGDLIVFPATGPYCQDSVPPPLPAAENGITGTWFPPTIDTSAPGVYEYIFIPDGNCFSDTSIEIEITPKQNTVFELVETYCINADPFPLPLTSTNGIQGTWSPAVIDTGTLGSSEYIFTPNQGYCAANYVLTVEVVESGFPTFNQIGPFCQNTVPPELPLPIEGVGGTWSPAVIDTSQIGIFQYTFTPVDSCFSPITIEIEIVEHITPTFNIPDFYCRNSVPDPLPTVSSNGLTGTWSPAVVDTSSNGIFIFTFTPDQPCADVVQIQIEIKPKKNPKFTSLYKVICKGAPYYVLPAVSDNGIPGTWSPAVIVTDETGVYQAIFTPDSGLDCVETVSVNFKIVTDFEPVFNNLPDVYCQGSVPDDLPLQSSNGAVGTWYPDHIDTGSPGSSVYTFTPDPVMLFCVDVIEKTIEIVKTEDPEFGAIGPYCQFAVPDPLPGVSENGYTGTWYPPAIDTNEAGTYVYTFTPDEEWICSGPVNKEITIESGVIPEFHLYGIYCQGSVVQELLDESLNGITGSWYPSVIDTSDLGIYIYTFTPQNGPECSDILEVHIQIVTEIIPEFNLSNTYCQGDSPEVLPDISNNGVIGVWEPSEIDTSVPGISTYTFIPEIENQCSNPIVKQIEVTPSLKPEFNLNDAYCINEAAETLSPVSDNGIPGSWYPDQIETNQLGSTVYVFTPDPELGCSYLYTLEVVVGLNPVIVGFEFGTDYIVVNATGDGFGTLEYSIDGIFWQQSPQFSNLIPGEVYTFYVKGRCNIVSKEAAILNVPNFFSPNGDGLNDFWEIRGMETAIPGNIRIFDRYGKMMVDRQFNGHYKWDGMYNGRNVPSGDYWYILEIPGNENEPARKYVGHISVRK